MTSEADTRANFIDPALSSAGWMRHQIIREYYFTDGRKLVGNQRGSRCFVDYLLHTDNQHLAIIEAKKQSAPPTQGLQQAIDYAQKLSVRFVYSTNGEKIYEFDLESGKGDFVPAYPTPDELLARDAGKSNKLGRQLRNIPFHLEAGMQPRYYQELAVHAATDAIGSGKERILLTLATGTGKTFIAFQIVHKLFQSRWSRHAFGKRRPRILFLADRNILADQAINTFNPYEKDLIKIDGEEIRKRHGIVPTNAHIFFAIYQAIAERENIGGYYRAYPEDFFDLILIDECHRGAAKNEGSWRAILDHFAPAVHLGLTATPKRTDNIDTYTYFGSPVYEYSLKEGINDGFLTPYRVKRIRTNLDELLLTADDQIIKGESNQDLYESNDFDKNIVADERTDLVAKAILDNINPMEKTIIFCTNQTHALTMRDMINRHKTVTDPSYCVRVTSDEGKAGRDLLERFQDNDRDIPTILTSSQMLTTGVD
ncbi:MAG: DEAD/DEAH box helicase family protein, partial [Mariprofundales bacterium]|nr:DEAD/DEAH box helicase family protein [Mariprofundales bacterium]